MLIGHKKILDYFESAAKNGQLAHTYCFAGLSAVGKGTAARKIASLLLNVPEEKLGMHPDFYFVRREEDLKTGKLKKEISVAQARELRSRLERKSWLGGYQVAIIDEAELLNEESGNALLKILEEPPEKSILFLLAKNEQDLLPTIRSRSQIFYFSLVREGVIAQALVEMGCAEGVAEKIARASWGRPGKALDLFRNEDLYKEELAEIERWNKLLGAPFYLKIKLIEDLFGDKEDAVRGRDRLQKILDLWTVLGREILIQKKSGPPAESMVEIIDVLCGAKKMLGQNIHPRLLMEQAVMGL